jgi:hypothetical protein
MPIPLNQELYDKVKKYANKIYKHNSAYKSMYIQKLYKKLNGTYKEDGREHALTRWKNERWFDIGNREYPVYRPMIRINKHTPLTIYEIDKNDLKKKIEQKQLIRGFKNLSPFKHK